MTILNVPVAHYRADPEFEMFGESVRRSLDEHASPSKIAEWREAGIVSPELWSAAVEAGLLGLFTSREYGGIEGDFRHEVILIEEIGRRGFEGWDVTLHNAIIAPYGSTDQKNERLPPLTSGEVIGAIVMTEPGTGSDLQAVKTSAVRDGNPYLINGSKTFITNGQSADLIRYDKQRYVGHHLIENAFCRLRTSAAWPPATTSLLPTFSQALPSLPPWHSGSE